MKISTLQSYILDFLAKPNDDFDVPPHLLRQCVVGRDKILCRIQQHLRDWACLYSVSPIPDQKCTRIKSCTSSRALAIMMIPSNAGDSSMGIEMMEKNLLPSEINDLICRECRQSLQAAVEQFRVNLWKDLPFIFKLGDNWDALKDF